MTRMAGEMTGPSIARIVEMFMSRGSPRPDGVSLQEWAAAQAADARAIAAALERQGSDPRDYKVESGLWASQMLPPGVTIDQAIRDGVWMGPK